MTPENLHLEVMLGRRFNPSTQMWEARGLEPIAAEVMEQIRGRGATVFDLLVVLATRDASARVRAINDG